MLAQMFYRIIAELYAENETPENAEKYLLKSGFIPENHWITIGPFKIEIQVVFYTPISLRRPHKLTQPQNTTREIR